MLYDVETSWRLLDTCNFRCKYCFSSTNKLSSKTIEYASASSWAKAFDQTNKKWLIHITGGEPTLYPNFIELCSKLTANHYIAINSNLSFPSINEFSQILNPKSVHYIHASLHYYERSKKSIEDFVEKVSHLSNSGFNVLISAVMTPEIIDNYHIISGYFDSNNMVLIPKILRDEFEGKVYPGDYTEVQKLKINQYLDEAQTKYEYQVLKNFQEAPTLNMFEDKNSLETDSHNFHGKLCRAGISFVRIKPNGDVFRCSSKEHLGNILQGSLNFFDSPKTCDTSFCPYFCKKYTKNI